MNVCVVSSDIVVAVIELPDTFTVDDDGRAARGAVTPEIEGMAEPETYEGEYTAPDGAILIAHREASVGWVKKGNTLKPPPEADQGNGPVPFSITPLQARNGLRAWGIGRQQISDFIAQIRDKGEREAAEDAWEYATMIERANPLIAQCAAFLSKSDAEVDDFFRHAAAS